MGARGCAPPKGDETMITGIKLSRVEAHRDKDDEISGLSINISVDSVAVKTVSAATNS